MAAPTRESLLDVKNLSVHIGRAENNLSVLEEVNLAVKRAEVLGVVGESGSGKSLMALSIMRLLSRSLNVTAGSITFKDRRLLELSEEDIQDLRGNEISMIFQDPMSALNPTMQIGQQVTEGAIRHGKLAKSNSTAAAIELLTKVGLPRAAELVNQYPHELSGGMRQRVMIAMAIACSPNVLIADEPTTALDPTTQARILDLLSDLRDQYGLGLLLITHDFGVIAERSDRVVVMYAGQVVETGLTTDVLKDPSHPYTIALLASIPDANLGSRKNHPLTAISGTVPTVAERGNGCAFASRCPEVHARCTASPPMIEISETRAVKCWLRT